MYSIINIQSIFITNLMGFAILLITVADGSWRNKTNSKQIQILQVMILTALTSVVADPLCFICDGRQGLLNTILVYVGNTWLYMMNMILSSSWILFLKSYLHIQINKTHKFILQSLITLGALFLCINFFKPIVFKIDILNVYSRGPLFFYYIFMELFILLDSLVLYFKARKESGLLKYFPVHIFIIPILAGMITQTIVYGISTIWPSVCVSICGIIFSLQSELLFIDKLTGLHNRFYIEELIKKLTKSNEYSLILLDLDNFKSINDRYGMSVGDLAICETANRLSECVGTLGEVIRYAGDEFLIIIHTTNQKKIEELIKKMKLKLDEFTLTGENRFTLSVSAGFTTLDLNQYSFEEHVNLADKRMYEDKRSFYQQHPQFENRNSTQIVVDSKEGLENNQMKSLLNKLEKDPLTGCYTKSFFFEHVDQILSENIGKAYDMVCLEIQSYDLLIGRYGNYFCNSFIKSLSSYIMESLQEGNVVGRVQDNQIVFLRNHISLDEHQQYIDQFLELRKQNEKSTLDLKAGVYQNVDRTLSCQQIYEYACMPIKSIVFDGSRHVAEFDESIKQQSKRLQEMTEHMDKALINHEFEVYYQPKYNPIAHTIHGAEALVRWIHPTMGFMNPAEFISLFESNGFIFQLDKYVLEKACQDIVEWKNKYDIEIPISINISQVEFDKTELISILESIVDKYHIAHQLIHFEITETKDAIDAKKRYSIIQGLKEKGFVIELDDFGVGYSTLNALANLPIDVVKMDKSLIQGIADSKYQGILRASLFATYCLNLPVVIEGVETKEQLDFILTHCRDRINLSIQGYYYSKPLPKQGFEALMFKG